MKQLIEQNQSCMNTVTKVGVQLKVKNFLIVGFRILCLPASCSWNCVSVLYVVERTLQHAYTQTPRQKNKLQDVGQFLISGDPKKVGKRALSLGVMTRTSYFFASPTIPLLLSLYWRLVPSHSLENLTDQNLTTTGDISSLKKHTFPNLTLLEHLLMFTSTAVVTNHH